MAEGFQLIHAFLTFEGIPRKWSNPQFGDMDTELLNWRQKAQAIEGDDEEDDEETLAI